VRQLPPYRLISQRHFHRRAAQMASNLNGRPWRNGRRIDVEFARGSPNAANTPRCVCVPIVCRVRRGEFMRHRYKRIGWPTIAGLGVVVVAFMLLSLLVTATGTARFAVAMGYDAAIGYVIGSIFDLAKGVVLVAVLAPWRRRVTLAAVLAVAWACLVSFSWLATHATVRMAIASIERTGTWKMEVRGNAKAELATVEQRLAALSRPAPLRPAKTVREALAGTSVPRRHVEGQPRVRQHQGERLLRQGLRAGGSVA